MPIVPTLLPRTTTYSYSLGRRNCWEEIKPTRCIWRDRIIVISVPIPLFLSLAYLPHDQFIRTTRRRPRSMALPLVELMYDLRWSAWDRITR